MASNIPTDPSWIQDLLDALVGGLFAIIGGFIAGVISIITTRKTLDHQLKQLDRRFYLERAEQYIQQIENYVTTRARFIQSLTRPTGYLTTIRKQLENQVITTNGLWLQARSVAMILQSEELRNLLDQLEELFYKIWQEDESHIESNLQADLLTRATELQESIYKELYQIRTKLLHK